jgi:hypothetical protein
MAGCRIVSGDVKVGMKGCKMRILGLAAWLILTACSSACGEITRIWLTHRTTDPGRIVVNWETAEPGNSVVHYGLSRDSMETVAIEQAVTLHHVEIPIPERDRVYHYRVSTGGQSSATATFKAYPSDTLRVAVVANWQGQPDLDAIVKDDVHVLMTAGDNIDCLHRRCGVGVIDCTKPYADLIDRYPELFRSTPFMPVLGNHDREIRPRGPQPPAEPVYDIQATAFRKFFALPGDGWKWYFDVPEFDVRFVALDLNHISDMGTTWQTCQPLDKDSAQYRWYDRLMSGPKPPLVVTLYNERNASVRSQAGGSWGSMLRRGTIAITGFGYYAERAEVDGFTCYNTSLGGKGHTYPDPKSQFLASENNYILMTFARKPLKMTVEIKSLDGRVLDSKEFEAKDPYGGTGNPRPVEAN